MVSPILKIAGIYLLIVFGGVFFAGALLAWGEIMFKFKAILGARRGKGVVEIVLKNGRVSRRVVDYSDANINIKIGKVETSYDLKKALEDPVKYVRVLWFFVPVVAFREGTPAPLPMMPDIKSSFDMKEFNTALKVAYLAGATNPMLEKLKKIELIAMVGAGAAVICAVTVIYALPVLMPIIQGLWTAKNAGVLETFGAVFTAWLRGG